MSSMWPMPAFVAGATITFAGITASTRQIMGRPIGGAQVRIAAAPGNTTIAFIKFGDENVAATAADIPILPNSVELFTAPAEATHLAVFSATAATVYATSGAGT